MSTVRTAALKFGYEPRKKSIEWLISRLCSIERTISHAEGERLLILIEIEENQRWRESKEHKKYTWPEFLKSVCPRFGNTTYQAAKRHARKYGIACYEKWGHSKVTVFAKHEPYAKALIKVATNYVERTGKFPSGGTIDRMGQKLSGIGSRPTVSEVVQTTGTWRKRCRQAEKECKKLKKENVHLKAQVTQLKHENKRLRAKLNGDFAKKLKKLNPGK